MKGKKKCDDNKNKGGKRTEEKKTTSSDSRVTLTIMMMMSPSLFHVWISKKREGSRERKRVEEGKSGSEDLEKKSTSGASVMELTTGDKKSSHLIKRGKEFMPDDES